MHVKADKGQENQDKAAANQPPQGAGSGEATFEFVDNRAEAVQLREFQALADNSVLQRLTPWANLPGKENWSGGKLIHKTNYHVSMQEHGEFAGFFSQFHVTDEMTEEEKNPHFFFNDEGKMHHGSSNQHPQSVEFQADDELNKDPHTWSQLKTASQTKADNFVEEAKDASDWKATSFTLKGKFPKAATKETVLKAMPNLPDAVLVATKGKKVNRKAKKYWWTVKATFPSVPVAYARFESFDLADPWTDANEDD